MQDSPGTWGSRSRLPCLLHRRWWSPGGDGPSLHFWWKIRRSEKPPADSQRDGKDRHTGGAKDKRQTGKEKKNFPTKTTTAGRCGSLWHLLLMDGCLQLFCALRTRHHHTAQASPAWHPHPAPTDGRNGRRGPPSQAASPQTPAASHQRELRGPPPAVPIPTDCVCQRQETGGGAGEDCAHGGRRRRAGAARRWPCWGHARPHRYFGTPGRVPRPASTSAFRPPLSLRTSLEGHICLCNLTPPPPPA